MVEQAEALPQGTDKRGASRHTLVIRVAKLVCQSGEYLCIVRDISAGGARLRLFHDMPAELHVFLELANGERFAMKRVWQRDDQAGFAFAAPLDVADFINETSPFSRRPVRLRMVRPSLIVVNGLTMPGMLQDMSQMGARIECDSHLAIDQLLRVDVDGAPSRMAKVRWRRQNQYGLVFEETFRLDELARLAWRLQPGYRAIGTAGVISDGANAPLRARLG